MLRLPLPNLLQFLNFIVNQLQFPSPRWPNRRNATILKIYSTSHHPIMYCTPNILSKIGIDVRNPLCDLLQGRRRDFAMGGGTICMLDHLRCALDTLHSQKINFLHSGGILRIFTSVNAVTVHGYKIEVLHNQLAFELCVSVKISGGISPQIRSGGWKPPSTPPGCTRRLQLPWIVPSRGSVCALTTRANCNWEV